MCVFFLLLSLLPLSHAPGKPLENPSTEKEIFLFLAVTNEYECLSQMNIAAMDKYNQIHQKFQHVNQSMRTLNDSNGKKGILEGLIDDLIMSCWICLATKLSSTSSQLDEIEHALTNLESTIMKLDAYSRSLESQVKKMEKTVSSS